jgi:hypothetical protein
MDGWIHSVSWLLLAVHVVLVRRNQPLEAGWGGPRRWASVGNTSLVVPGICLARCLLFLVVRFVFQRFPPSKLVCIAGREVIPVCKISKCKWYVRVTVGEH